MVCRKGLVAICQRQIVRFRHHPAGGDQHAPSVLDLIFRVPFTAHRKADIPFGISAFLCVKVIMDTIYGGNLTNAPLLRNLHPKVLGCTLAQIFAPCTDKVYLKER